MIHDFCVIGGGIVGLATAMTLVERHPGASIVVLEKEQAPGLHQTGHNSGVIHAGIYYPPGSLKAELCRRGAKATKVFCNRHRIPYEVCGKLLVATNAVERKHMEALSERAAINGIMAQRMDAAELREREPHIRGVGALLVRDTGIVDYRQICEAIAGVVRSAGGEVELGVTVDGIRETAAAVTVSAGERRWKTRSLVVCAGLQSDRMAMMAGLSIDHRIVPFRGEYYRLPDEKSNLIRHLIYPIPDPALPFLGIHLTRMMDGSVTVGPNAVLGWAREGYRKYSFSPRDAWTSVTFPGFWRTIRRNLRSGITEMRNAFWKAGYLQECRKYCPELTLKDLQPHAAGIRAQAVLRDGRLVHDFLFAETDRMLHVCNAPSPAATSAIPIAEMIVDRLMGRARPTTGTPSRTA